MLAGRQDAGPRRAVLEPGAGPAGGFVRHVSGIRRFKWTDVRDLMIETWIFLTLLIACLFLGGVALFQWRRRRRYARGVAELNREIVEVAEAAAFGKRIAAQSDSIADLGQLGETINRLFDALSTKDRQMRQREALFQDLANTMPEVVLVHRERVIFANPAAAGLLGLQPEQLAGRSVTDLVRPAYRALVRKNITARLAGEAVPDQYEMQLISGDERSMWVEAAGTLIDYRGQKAILTIARDISYRKNIEASLGHGKQQAQITLESIGEGVITTDTHGVIDYLNGAAEELTGMRRDQAMGKRLTELMTLVDEVDRRDMGDPVARCLAERRRVGLGRRALMVSADGSRELSVELTASPVIGESNLVAGAVVIMHDVTEMRGLTRRISYQAAHDALTGLVNRAEFERRLEEALESARGEGSSHMLCFMDLDRFKAVNDTCGHLAGDNMLREVAKLIRNEVRDSDIVARLGGDEFAMLLIRCPLEKARQIADDVCAAVRDYRFAWQDRIFSVGISIGLVEVSRDSGSLKDLVSAADSACYLAKQQGRGRVHVYSARDEVSARQRGDIHWLQQLQAALRENRFEIHTQPIIASSGRVTGGPAVEVLLRMVNEEQALIPPRQFIPAAERYQLMASIDRWVVQATLAALSQGTLRLPDARSCTINLSGQAMDEEGFLEFVVECLDHSQVSPDRICFEVGEGAVMERIEQARRFVAVLHGMGCQFGLDDFGSGFGSFTTLRDLSIDYLKIDGAFTRNLRPDTLNHQLVDAITGMGRTLGFRVIAEQVETQADFEALRAIGVDFIQGYFVDKPHRLGEPGSALSVI
jgi:diguanylate cyclase (GGDEF)-like protein/PAS domain S-box-containing protein